MHRRGVASLLLALAIPAFAQVSQEQNEGRLHADFRVEGEALAGSCLKFSFGNLIDCVQTMVTAQPMHIASGSLAPQNGTGFGLAFVEHKDLADEWRLNWDADAVASIDGSWRAGAYMKAYRLGGKPIRMEFGTAGKPVKKSSRPLFKSAPLMNLFSESDSLNRVDFFGLGPNTLPSYHTTYGFSENVTGLSAIAGVNWLPAAARVSLVGELNGRFPSLRPGNEASIPSIETVFDESTAPGLTRQPVYFQPTEGVRIEPALFKDLVRLNYLLQFQQFIAVGDSRYSFQRWNADFEHEIPLYRLVGGKLGKSYSKIRTSDLGHNGPDDCTGSSAAQNIALKRALAADAKNAAKAFAPNPCPIISTTENLEGSISLRLYMSESFAKAGSVVPFYFSPTIGGSDIDGNAMLASYPDYRFRGPDLLLLHGSFEHSLGKLPLGGIFSVDEGKIGLRRDDVDFTHLRHTFSAGVTVHAGGLPVISLMFAWGGPEGSHTIANINSSLMGGSGRPSLF